MRVHAIIIALNEEDFILETIRTLYPFCTGISIITQYDRDYYRKTVIPDNTVQKVLSHPDPHSKIHLVVRRFNDETASRNHEMSAILFDASKRIIPHGIPFEQISDFHRKPDYFLICDADEIYDVATLPAIISYLDKKRPRGMRVSAYEYYFNWNQRIPKERYVHHHFGFIKAGLLFEQRRVITWNEFRLKKLLARFGVNGPMVSSLFGFIDCPQDVGMFHHGGYVRRDEQKMREKLSKHSHPENHDPSYLNKSVNQDFEFVPDEKLPINIREGDWPETFFKNK